MTYSFDPNIGTDKDLVRFHIGDNKAAGHYLEDETIKFFINRDGWKKAVVTCILYIITQLSQPDFVQDWMEVSNEKAREGYENLLKLKKSELGLTGFSIVSSISLPTRADSYQTSNDYTELSSSDDIPFNIEEGTP